MKKLYLPKVQNGIILMLFMFCAMLGFSQGSENFGTVTPNNTNYGAKSTTTGWSFVNACVLASNNTDAIERCEGEAVAINGKTSAVGSITSPLLTGGCGTLSFHYGNSYSENNGISFQLQIKNADAQVVFDTTVTVSQANAPKGATLDFNATVHVAGDFQIVITNLSPSHSTSNKDRVAFSCFEWTAQEGEPEVVVSAPTFSPAAGSYLTAQEIVLTASNNAIIHYTLDGTTPDVTSPIYNEPFTISENTTIKAIAISGDISSMVATANYVFPISVANIAAFKAANTATNNDLYKITGDLTFVYRHGNNIYLQDETGGLLVYDRSNPVITTTYQEGDVFSGGLIGSYTLYNGTVELIPAANTAVATNNVGAITPVVATLSEIIENYAEYESKLVTIEGATVEGDVTFSTDRSSGVNISQGDITSNFQIYNSLRTLDLSLTQGQTINITGFVIRYVNSSNNKTQIVPRANADIRTVGPAVLPHTTTFAATSLDLDEWILDNETSDNKWFIGQAAGFDNEKLYISSNNGSTNRYDVTSSSIVKASRGYIFPATLKTVTFDARANGESSYDYLEVSVVDENDNETVLGVIESENEWNSYSYEIPAAISGIVRLVFTWTNDNSYGDQFPAAIDNIVVKEITCLAPTALNAVVNGTNANITWTAGGSETAWTFEYKLAEHEDWYTMNVTTPSVSLTDLQGNSLYDMRVKANCSASDESAYVTNSFSINCQNGSQTPMDFTIGTGTSTQTKFLGGLYGYDYTANLYTDLPNHGNVTAISFYVPTTYTVSGNYSLQLWAKVVPQDFTLNSSNTFAQMKAGATVVYQGVPTYTTSGWKEFTLQNPVDVPEGYALLVLSRATGCSASGGCSKSVQYTTTSNKVWYKRADTSDPGENVIGSISSDLPNIKINMLAGSCYDEIACVEPENLVVSNITINSADIAWTATDDSQTDFIVEYKLANEAAWTAVEVSNATQYTLTNLTQVSDYLVRVKANCGTNNYSLPTDAVAFTTSSVCPSVTNIYSYNRTNTVVVTWTPGGAETAWIFEIKNANDNTWISNVVTNPTTTVGGLVGGVTYDVRVKALCDLQDEDNQSPWATYQFVANCEALDIPYIRTMNSTTAPSCWEASNNTQFTTAGAKVSTEGWVMSPAFNIPANGTSYLHIFNNGSNDFTVKVSYRGTALTAFEEIYTGDATTEGEIIIEVPAMYNGMTTYFMIENNATSDYKLTYFEVSDCPYNVNNLVVSNVTYNSAELSWNSLASTQWIVRYSADGNTWNTLNTNNTVVTLTDLTSTSDYTVQVAPACNLDKVVTEEFTTECGLTELPYSENFDSYSSTTSISTSSLANCWDRMFSGTSTAYGAGIYSSSSYAASGTNSLRMYNYATTATSASYGNVYAILPEFNSPISNLFVTFDVRNQLSSSTYPGIFTIGVVTNPNDPDGSFVPYQTISGLTTTYVTEEISFENYSGANGRIALRMLKTDLASGTTYSYNSVYIDNLVVRELPACFMPTDIAVSTESDNTVVTWTGHGESSWNVKYGLSGFDPETEGTTVVTTTNSITLNGLMGSSIYDIYVQADCEASTSSWSTKISFATSCGILTVPYHEDMESYAGTSYTTAGVAPNCWETTTNNTSYPAPHVVSTSVSTSYCYPHSGTNALVFTCGSAGNDAYAVLPEFSNPLNELRISFWRKMESTSSGTLTLGYMSAGDFTAIQTIPSTSTVQKVIVDLNNVNAPAGARLAFNWHYTTSYYSCCIDDIAVTLIPNCSTPTGLTASNPTENTIDLTWNDNGSTSWNIAYGTSDFNPETEGTIVTTSSNSITLNNLSASSSYTVYVQSNCGDALSDWSDAVSFTTACGLITTYPYTENFDGLSIGNYSNPNLPDCWSSLNNVTTSSSSYPQLYVYNSSSYVHSSPNSLYFKSSNTTPEYVILPQFSEEHLTLNFWYRNEGTSTYNGTLIVGYMTDPNDASTFQEKYTCDRTTTMTEVFVDYENITGPYRIAFKYQGGSSNNYYLAIDDITVDAIMSDPCAITTLPFVEGFEAAHPLDCWSEVNVSTNAMTHSTTYAYEGSQSFRFSSFSSSSTGYDQYLITPEFNLHDVTSVNLSFWYRRGSGTENFKVGYSTTTNDLSAMTWSDEISNASSTWQEYTQTIPGDVKYICIHYYSNYKYYLYVDQFTVTENTIINKDLAIVNAIVPQSSCNMDGKPVSLVVQNMTMTDDVVTNFTASYALNGGDPVVENVTANIEPNGTYTFTFNTIPAYEETNNFVFTIDYNNDQNVANNVIEVAGGSIVNPITVPYVENFSNVSFTQNGWSYYDVNEDNSHWIENYGAPKYVASNTNAGDDWFITSCIELTAGTYQISYDYKAAGLYPENLAVYMGTDNTPSAMTTLIASNNGFENTAYVTNTADITIENDGIYYFGFYAHSVVGTEGIVVDNFKITPYVTLHAVANSHGNITPSGDVLALINSTKTFVVIPEVGYQLSNITVNGEEVVGTDATVSSYYIYNHNVTTTNDEIVANFQKAVAIHYNLISGNGMINYMFYSAPISFYEYISVGSSILSTFEAAPGYHIENININGVDYNNINAWNFQNVTEDQEVTITFGLNEYTINTMAYGNGIVSDGVTFTYDPAYSYTFEAQPGENAHIVSITRNNEELVITDPSSYTETLTNIVDNYNYVAHFASNYFTVNATAGANGMITPVGATTYHWGVDASYAINADNGYYIASVTVDGETTNYTQADAMNETVITFNNILADHNIAVTFAQYQYTITVNAGANGTIAPATSTYAAGTTPTFTITPATGYGIADVTVDGASVGTPATYTFTALNADHTIEATFSQYAYTINAIAGNGGNITPAGVTNMFYNGNQTYTITPETGYHIVDVYVDGVAQGAVTTYSFTNVQENHTIYAAFAANEYTITVNQPANGVITPSTITVLYGATPSFTITPATGYDVTTITLNGTNVIANATQVNGIYTYTLPAVAANQTLTATMTMKTFTINATAGANGTVTPAGNTTVNFGATRSYTITPANGYVIDNVTVDGMTVGAVASYTFMNVVANHTINATFKLEACEVPSNLQTINIDTTTATLSWYHAGAQSYDIQFKAVDAPTFTSISNVPGFTYNLTNLQPNTAYVWYVRANCLANNASEWTNGCVFRTLENTNSIGVEDYASALVKVYANSNNVYIINENGVQINNVMIYDIYGKLLYNGQVNSTSEVISMNVATGTYMVRLATDKGMLNYKLHLTR